MTLRQREFLGRVASLNRPYRLGWGETMLVLPMLKRGHLVRTTQGSVTITDAGRVALGTEDTRPIVRGS